MKKVLSIAGLVAVCFCVGCKGNGFDVLVDINPFKNPVGGLRFQPVPEEAPRVARNNGLEVHFNLKRDGVMVSNENISVDVRIPGDPPVQTQKPVEAEPKVQEVPAPVAAPPLLNAND